MLFRKLWLSLCAGALLAAHPLQAEEPTQLREVRVAYIGILPSETTEHAVYPTFDFLKSQLGHKYRFKLFDISNHDFLEEINVRSLIYSLFRARFIFSLRRFPN